MVRSGPSFSSGCLGFGADMDRQRVIDHILTLYAYRVQRDNHGLVQSMAFSLLNDMDDVNPDEADMALCAIAQRAQGIRHVHPGYLSAWAGLSPKTEALFKRCPECQAWGRDAHTMACSKFL